MDQLEGPGSQFMTIAILTTRELIDGSARGGPGSHFMTILTTRELIDGSARGSG